MLASLARDIGPPRLGLVPVGFDKLRGWTADTLAAALPAFLRSCARFLGRADDAPLDARQPSGRFGTVGDWRPVCRRAASVSQGDERAARDFFETAFAAMLAVDTEAPAAEAADGLFTGYYEVELRGSRHRHGPYQTPLYRRPAAALAHRYSRAEIATGALAGQGLELLWVDDPIAAFFLQIQGSGVVRLAEGGTVRVGYDGQNGFPYVPVGRLLLQRGAIPRDKMTMAAIRGWMVAHPKAGAGLRDEDPSYVYFREVKGPGPLGAEGAALTAGRSLAVDRRYIPLGVPVWVDAAARFPQMPGLAHLVVAQDVGGAIRGPVRGDYFWGTGLAAGTLAGETNARGSYYLLLPRPVAARLAATG